MQKWKNDIDKSYVMDIQNLLSLFSFWIYGQLSVPRKKMVKAKHKHM